jgi:pimeloyl-ACP methyl ester carboxylesterase
VTTFVLVHGAWHGAWCWERLVPALRSRGHDAVAMDLPAGDGSATYTDYAHAVLRAMEHVDGPVTLVGHSLGAMTVPVVASMRPVETTLLLCGVTPNLSGQPWDDAPPMEVPGAYDALVAHPDGATSWPTLESATQSLYGECAPADAAWAFSLLRKQSSTGLWADAYPLTEWPQTRFAAVCCASDRAITAEFVKHTVRERLGIDAVEIPGDHSPFLRDAEGLADVLIALGP